MAWPCFVCVSTDWWNDTIMAPSGSMSRDAFVSRATISLCAVDHCVMLLESEAYGGTGVATQQDLLAVLCYCFCN